MAGMIDLAGLALGTAISVALIAQGVSQSVGERQLSRRLSDLSHGGATAGENCGSTAGRSRLATLLNGGGGARAEVEHYLAAAGFLSPNGALNFALLRLGTTAGAGLLLYAYLAMTRPASAVTWALPIGVAALLFLGAKMALKMSSVRRSRKISAELPFVLDIFVMMVESGASLDQCFRTFAAAEGSAAPIVRMSVIELVDDIQRGMSYDQALARWSDRLGVTGAQELTAVLRRSLNQGTELAGALREFAREFSERRVFAARESIGRKTTQMTVAMLVLLMPALMIVLAGPAVSTLGSTIHRISNTGGPA